MINNLKCKKNKNIIILRFKINFYFMIYSKTMNKILIKKRYYTNNNDL